MGTLRKIARSHRQGLLTDDLSDNIASHSFRVAIIGYVLAKMEKVDPKTVALMCLFHDIGEARSGDQNWIHKRYVKVFEDEITTEQLTGLAGDNETLDLAKNYHEKKSREAIVAKDADRLDQLFLQREYEWRGNQEASRWLKGKATLNSIETKSAKRLAKELYVQKPSDWWSKGLWTQKRR